MLYLGLSVWSVKLKTAGIWNLIPMSKTTVGNWVLNLPPLKFHFWIVWERENSKWNGHNLYSWNWEGCEIDKEYYGQS
jgi:hypothetical protein